MGDDESPYGLRRHPLGGHEPGTCATCDEAVATMRESAERQRRERHEHAWWATYRAALTGYCANPGGFAGRTHDAASLAADRAHGPLPEASKP